MSAMRSAMRTANSGLRLPGSPRAESEMHHPHKTESAPAPTPAPMVAPSRLEIKHTPRSSRMDLRSSKSDIGTSSLKGWFNLFGVCLVLFIVTQNVQSLVAGEWLVGVSELFWMFSEVKLWLLIPIQAALASVVLVYASLMMPHVAEPKPDEAPRARSTRRLMMVHYAYCAVFLGVCSATCVRSEWPFTQGCFFIALAMVHWMKMHSYLMINLELAPKERVICNGNAYTVFADWLYFMFAPTLVYSVDYPRTPHIRWFYVVEKAALASFVFAGMHVISTRFIVPLLKISASLSLLEFVSRTVIPFTLMYVMLFYLVFDCVLNGTAELLRFADRQFYSDWWNSTSFDEFARKWNKPVQRFILKHIYSEIRLSTHKGRAMLTTFLISAVLHEFVMFSAFKVLRPYLLVMQMSQLLWIWMGKRVKGTAIGNLIFWTGMSIGVPMLAWLYGREYYA